MWRILLACSALAVASCGNDDGEAAPESLGDELGCETYEQSDTEEVFVSELYKCERGGAETSVYTFASSSARDSWRDVAEKFGTVVIDQGDTWLEVD